MAARKQRKPVIETQVKDPDLVSRRRRQIVDGAVALFFDKGYHRTTTREIAKAVGFSIGLLYEYVKSKEDILALVCENIHEEMERGVRQAVAGTENEADRLSDMIREYFSVCNRMSDHILLIYQETQSLPESWRGVVLDNEVRMAGIFHEALSPLVRDGLLNPMDERARMLLAHDIVVWGHAWALRRWFLARRYSLEEYTKHVVSLILNNKAQNPGSGKPGKTAKHVRRDQ